MKLTIKKNNGNESKNASKKQVNNPAPAKTSKTKDEVKVVPASTVPASIPAEAIEIKTESKPKAASAKGGYSIQTYTTKKGGTAYLLFGFDSKESAEKIAEKCSKTVSASWRRNDKNEQMFCLSFGTRYGDVAKNLCAALNKGDKKSIDKACAASKDVYALAVAAGKAEREAKKQERAEAKAETAAAKAKDEPAPAAKGYSDKDVAAMLNKIMAGGDIPESVRKHMKLAKAA